VGADFDSVTDEQFLTVLAATSTAELGYKQCKKTMAVTYRLKSLFKACYKPIFKLQEDRFYIACKSFSISGFGSNCAVRRAGALQAYVASS
jgi:hypothetical protein